MPGRAARTSRFVPPISLMPEARAMARRDIDRPQPNGHTVGEEHDDDPVIVTPAGRAVHTWREDSPGSVQWSTMGFRTACGTLHRNRSDSRRSTKTSAATASATHDECQPTVQITVMSTAPSMAGSA